MTFRLLLAALVSGLATVGAASAFARAPEAGEVACQAPPAAIEANNKLGFKEFDQSDAIAYTPWWLSDRRCFAEAARVSELYLLFGPELSEREKDVVTWHMAQNLAYAGREDQAGALMASTRRPPEVEPDQFDWNSYLVGTWSFLVKDRPRLEAARAKLVASPGQRNAINAATLGRLLRCFDRSYDEAIHAKACAAEPAR